MFESIGQRTHTQVIASLRVSRPSHLLAQEIHSLDRAQPVRRHPLGVEAPEGGSVAADPHVAHGRHLRVAHDRFGVGPLRARRGEVALSASVSAAFTAAESEPRPSLFRLYDPRPSLFCNNDPWETVKDAVVIALRTSESTTITFVTGTSDRARSSAPTCPATQPQHSGSAEESLPQLAAHTSPRALR